MIYAHESGLQNDGKRTSRDTEDRQTTGELWIVPIGGTGKSQSSQAQSFGATGTFDDDGSVMTAGTWLLFLGVRSGDSPWIVGALVGIAGRRSNYGGCGVGKGKVTNIISCAAFGIQLS